MTLNRFDDIPPFPEGSDWADPESAFDDSAFARSARLQALAVLWLCVAAFAIITVTLVRADTVIYEATNIDDIGPFDGVTAFFAIVMGVLFGALPLALAVFHSAAATRKRKTDIERAGRRASLYTAICGLINAPYWALGAHQTAQERQVAEAALHQAYGLFGLTAVIGLIPFAFYLAVCRSQRS